MTDQEPTHEIIEPTALEAMVRADIDVQISTAKRYPRAISACRDRALSMATLDEETAIACSYALPRDGKALIGPSVRLAEIVASAWTNLRVASRIIGEDARFVTAQAICHDMETNVAISKEVRRRITNKHGKRYGDDMIAVTANAAASIALRNAVFAVIPKAHWKRVFDTVQKAAKGDEKTLKQRRKSMVEWFKRRKISPGQLARLCGKTSMDDVGVEEVALAQGLRTALLDGDMSVEEMLASINGDKPKTNAELEAEMSKPLKEATDKIKEEVIEIDEDGTVHPAVPVAPPETRLPPPPFSTTPLHENIQKKQLKAVQLYMKLSTAKKEAVHKAVGIGSIEGIKAMVEADDLQSVVDACLSA